MEIQLPAGSAPTYAAPRMNGLHNWAAVVPMANEEPDFEPFIQAMAGTMDAISSGRVYLVIDRVSRDRTREMCEGLSRSDSRFVTLWCPENRNLADAYFAGFRAALADGHEFIIEMDAGLSHDPRAIPMFLRVLNEGNDCAFGSRFINGGSMADSPPIRRFLSRGGTLAAQILLGARLADMTSGYQGFHRSVLEKLVAFPLRSQAHFYQTEVRHLLRKHRIIEVPIHYRAPRPRVAGGSISDSVRVLIHYTLLRLTGKSPHI